MSSPWGARLFSGEQVIQSLRNVGYQCEGNAIADIVDNSIEAGAEKIEIIFDEEKARPSKPSIAIIDNGHGMKPEYLPLAIGIPQVEQTPLDWGVLEWALPAQVQPFPIF